MPMMLLVGVVIAAQAGGGADPGVFGLVMIVFLPIALVIMIVIWLQWMLTVFFVVDREEGVFQAIGSSKSAMTGHKGTVFLVYLVFGLLGGVMLLCTCYLAALALIPYAAILNAVIYAMATGQPLAGRKAAPYAG